MTRDEADRLCNELWAICSYRAPIMINPVTVSLECQIWRTGELALVGGRRGPRLLKWEELEVDTAKGEFDDYISEQGKLIERNFVREAIDPDDI